jgi:plasmid maintenance system antidote protein VapI
MEDIDADFGAMFESSLQSFKEHQIVKGKAGITADTALRMGRYFQVSPRFWVNLQAHYDLETTRDRIEKRLKKEVRVFVAA